jgi:hypothetical protein
MMNTDRAKTIRLWLVRAILLFATLLYAEIGRRFLFDPVTTIARFGIELPQPASVTTIRAIMGAFFFGLAVTAGYGLIFSKRTVACLWVMVTFIFFVLVGRILGIQLDGADTVNMDELRNEAMGMTLYVTALIVMPRQR